MVVCALGGLAALLLSVSCSTVYVLPNGNNSKSEDVTDISGLVRMKDGMLIAIHDTKVKSPADKGEKPRVSLVDGKFLKMTAFPIRWLEDGPPASDLEAGCRLPYSKDVLLFESGYFEGKYGRVFRCTPDHDDQGHISGLRVVQFWKLPEAFEKLQVEGALCFARRSCPQLVIASRDGSLHTAPLDLNSPNGAEIALVPMPVCLPSFPELKGKDDQFRVISDMYVDKEGTIWAAATRDLGGSGPFRSVVYNLGSLQVEGPVYIRQPSYWRKATIEGLKVEALEDALKSGHLVFGTDDENFGGAVRPFEKP
jgi:hypothetical protein